MNITGSRDISHTNYHLVTNTDPFSHTHMHLSAFHANGNKTPSYLHSLTDTIKPFRWHLSCTQASLIDCCWKSFLTSVETFLSLCSCVSSSAPLWKGFVLFGATALWVAPLFFLVYIWIHSQVNMKMCSYLSPQNPQSLIFLSYSEPAKW